MQARQVDNRERGRRLQNRAWVVLGLVVGWRAADTGATGRCTMGANKQGLTACGGHRAKAL